MPPPRPVEVIDVELKICMRDYSYVLGFVVERREATWLISVVELFRRFFKETTFLEHTFYWGVLTLYWSASAAAAVVSPPADCS